MAGNLKYLKKGDKFYFDRDNDQVVFIVVFQSKSIIQFDAEFELNSTSLTLSKSFDFLINQKISLIK